MLLIKPSHSLLTFSWRAFEDHSLLLWVAFQQAEKLGIRLSRDDSSYTLIINMTVSHLERRIDTDLVVLYILDQCIWDCIF